MIMRRTLYPNSTHVGPGKDPETEAPPEPRAEGVPYFSASTVSLASLAPSALRLLHIFVDLRGRRATLFWRAGLQRP